jgi:hypothetical protein
VRLKTTFSRFPPFIVLNVKGTAIDCDVGQISTGWNRENLCEPDRTYCLKATVRANIPNEVLEFWFDPANRRCWFETSPDFDELVRQRLTHFYADAVEGCLDDWKDLPNGRAARSDFGRRPIMPDRRPPRALLVATIAGR